MTLVSPSSDPFALPVHGGNLGHASLRFGEPAAGWVDLSTGINPFPYAIPEVPAECWARLPDSRAETSLRIAAASAYGGDPDGVVIAAGTQTLIQVLPKVRMMSRVAVISPTYSEHQVCWASAGHQLLPCETLERIGDADVVVVTNPNNPDGRRFDPDRLVRMAKTLHARGGLLVVDEAFADVTPELSVAGHVQPGLVVLRSFGKFFGLAGLRLGFALADAHLARQLRAALGPWPASGPAMAVGTVALADAAWITATRLRLTTESAELANLLKQGGLALVGGTSLFQLVNAPRAWALYEYLGQQGILARPYAAAPRWLRFGLPKNKDHRNRLRKALAAWPG